MLRLVPTVPEAAPLGGRIPAGRAIDARQAWAAHRLWMETQHLVTGRYGGRRPSFWFLFDNAVRLFGEGLKVVGAFERGNANARDVVLTERTLRFGDALPRAFDGFTIGYMSDLHIDGMPGLEESVARMVSRLDLDLCVFGGDYRNELTGPNRPVMSALRTIVEAARVREGLVGVLGNHDDGHMVAPLEAMGIRMLINERVMIERGGERLQLIGTDDVHYYYTEAALHALEPANDAFTVALVHSAELFDVAAECGVDLYLCGHTHAGQIALPGGRPVFRHLKVGRQFATGHWTHRGMQGVTSSGVGTSAIPVRYNTRGEVLVVTLKR